MLWLLVVDQSICKCLCDLSALIRNHCYPGKAFPIQSVASSHRAYDTLLWEEHLRVILYPLDVFLLLSPGGRNDRMIAVELMINDVDQGARVSPCGPPYPL